MKNLLPGSNVKIVITALLVHKCKKKDTKNLKTV